MENKDSKQKYDLSKIYTYYPLISLVYLIKLAVAVIIVVILHLKVLLKISSFCDNVVNAK